MIMNDSVDEEQVAVVVARAFGAVDHDELGATMLEGADQLNAAGFPAAAAQMARTYVARVDRLAAAAVVEEFSALKVKVDGMRPRAGKPVLVAAAAPSVASEPQRGRLDASSRTPRRYSAASPVRRLSTSLPSRKLSVPGRK